MSAGVRVRLAEAHAAAFGLILLIRTGPADYSQRFVTDIRRSGYHVTGGELHQGGKFGCPRYCTFVPTPDEHDVYAAAGLPWVEPRLRA